MKKRTIVSLIIIVLMFFIFSGNETLFSSKSKRPYDNSDLLKKMHKINKQLAAMGFNIAVEAIDFYTIGWGRPSIRIHQDGARWVPNDPFRLADGTNITYLVDQSDGSTASGLINSETEAAIDNGLDTWNTCKALRKVEIVKRADSGADPDIFDYFYGYGGLGYEHYADIVNAGWLPRGFFEAVGGPGGGDGIIAFSVTFIWLESPGGPPTDMNGDNYFDTALNEVYYNDTFGTPGEPRENFPWGIDVSLPGIEVESVALHENGHSLGLGHFGPPPRAVMNDGYRGICQYLYPIDLAGMSAVWLSWPNP
jgi:hypothetical protein